MLFDKGRHPDPAIDAAATSTTEEHQSHRDWKDAASATNREETQRRTCEAPPVGTQTRQTHWVSREECRHCAVPVRLSGRRGWRDGMLTLERQRSTITFANTFQIGCSYCDTWQHFHCYGFTGPDDPRVPEDHACYQCLLAGRDEVTLSTLKELALKRRGMSIALRVGLWRKGNLAKEMGELSLVLVLVIHH